MDPVKSQKPQEPLVGAGKGGRVGASATQHVVQSLFRLVSIDSAESEDLIDLSVPFFTLYGNRNTTRDEDVSLFDHYSC
jgi:hypothetical protein